MNKQEILTHLYDMEHMVEWLKVKHNENGQWDIIQKIYTIISLLNWSSDTYDLQKENLLLLQENKDLKDRLVMCINMLKLAKAMI